MKTKVFILVCLIIGIGMTQLSAQNGNKGSGIVKFDFPVEGRIFPVFCDGIIVDHLYSPTGWTSYTTQHYVNGELTWFRDKPNKDVEMVSLKTHEVFRLGGGMDQWHLQNNSFVWTSVFIGKMGSHYSFRITFDYSTGEMIDINSNCHLE